MTSLEHPAVANRQSCGDGFSSCDRRLQKACTVDGGPVVGHKSWIRIFMQEKEEEVERIRAHLVRTKSIVARISWNLARA